MSAIPVEPAASTSTVDAFRSAIRSAGETIGADPGAWGQTIMSGLESFRAQEADFQDVAVTAAAVDPSSTRIGADLTGTTGATVALANPDVGTGPQATTASLRTTQKRAVGLMMQTYSFALEATLVGNAATTFTNSVNTLIKTQ